MLKGEGLEGWTVFPKECQNAGTWTRRGDVLACSGDPIGYIRTEKQYTNFELTLEWRFDPTKGAGNSGVLLRVQGDDKVWPKSLEAQLHSLNAGDIWNIDSVSMTVDSSRTERRRTKKLKETNEKPLGEWNRYRIVVDGGNVSLYVNDLLQNEAKDVAVNPGWIALQSEGAAIEFRSIEIREITAPATSAKPAAPSDRRERPDETKAPDMKP